MSFEELGTLKGKIRSARWHDAIFLAVGLGETNKLNIPGEDLEGVFDALHFIDKIKDT